MKVSSGRVPSPSEGVRRAFVIDLIYVYSFFNVRKMDWFSIYAKEMTEMEAKTHRVVAKRACCSDSRCSSSHSETERAQLLSDADD
jgi:hypothetical protein